MALSIEIVRDCIVLLVSAWLFILLIYRFYFKKTAENTTQRMSITVLTYMISVFILFLLQLIAEFTEIPLYAWVIVLYTTICLSYLSIYILTIMRLSYTFRDSAFQISNKIIYTHIILIIVCLMLSVLFAISLYANGAPGLGETDRIIAATVISMVMIGYIHLVYKFNYNLFQLVLMQRTTSTHPSNTQSDIELNIRQKQLIQTIVKQTVLSCWVCLFYSMNSISFLIIAIIDPKSNINVLHDYEQWMIAVVNVAVGISVSLTFSINSRSYNKLCTLCHTGCNQICESCVQKSIAPKIEGLFSIIFIL